MTCLNLNLSVPLGAANGISFVPDRYGVANSAVYVDSQYLQLPALNYFSGDLTVTGWVYVVNFAPVGARLLDCAFASYDAFNSLNYAWLILSIGWTSNSNQPYGQNFNNKGPGYSYKPSSGLTLQQWGSLSFVISGTTAYIYTNGANAVSGTIAPANNVTRYFCYFGKSNWPTNGNAKAYFDDIVSF